MSESETLEIKADVSIDDAGSVTGLAWPFGAPDIKGDLIARGAFSFANTLPMVMEHDQKQVVGVWESFAETDKGLVVKGRLFLDGIEPARAAYRQLRSGRMSGLSIGYRLHEAKARPEGGRVLTDLTINEISFCRCPVHPEARVIEVKSMNEETSMNTAVNTETKDAPAFEQKAFDALQARLDKLEAKANRLPASNDNQANDNIELKALASFVRSGDASEIKSASTENDPGGAYFVLPTVDTRIRTLLTDLSPMRTLAEVVSITGGSYERFYSMGRRGAQWVSERADRPQDTARPDLIKHAYSVAELYAAPTTTRQMLDDASFDVAGWLINNAAHDFAETEGEAFLSGDGTDNTPKGLLAYQTTPEKDFTRAWGNFQYVPAGHATAPTDKQVMDNLIRLVATLRRPYKAGAQFLMNSNTAIRLRQIVDANGRYLWAPTGNLIEGVEHPLLGHRVVIDEGMPDIGANAHPIAFGDFSQGYVIVDRQGIRTEQDVLTQKGRVILDTYKRVGGGAGDFNAVKFLKIAAA